MRPSFSVITPVFNGAATIAHCLSSVSRQTVPCEHIVIDGGSTDSTLEVVKQFPHVAKVISERDAGIYDAMNKGIRLATNDVVGILNCDDFYVDEHVLAKVATGFESSTANVVFADMVYIDPDNEDQIVRFYSGADFTPKKLAMGWMPPHPTLFVKRDCYLNFGLFKTGYRIAADFELVARFFHKHGIQYRYLPEVLVKMRTGGVSTRSIKSNIILNSEIRRACDENGIKTSMLRIYSKYLWKWRQLISRPT